MIKNIIFDIGNVLVAFCWQEHYAKFGYSREVLDRLAKATVQSSIWIELDRGVWTEEEILRGFIHNDPGIEKEIREALADKSGMVARYDYAVPWIKELKEKGYGVYYLSNFSESMHRDCGADMEAYLREMDGGILSYTEKIVKPDPNIYRLLLKRFGLKPEECVFMDDSPANVEGAVKEGIHGIVFRSKKQAVEELRAIGVDV